MRTQTRIKIKSAMPRPVWNMISSAYRRNMYSRYKKDMTRHPDSMSVFCPCCGLKCTTAVLFAEADLKLDIQDTGLPDNSYDVIFCNHVLEHVDDYMKALRELRRILRPGGVLICSFPFSPDIEYVDEDPSVTSEEERLKRFGQSDHVRLFGINAGLFMEDAGFEVSVIDGKDCPEEVLPVTAPCKYDINRLFLCRKE